MIVKDNVVSHAPLAIVTFQTPGHRLVALAVPSPLGGTGAANRSLPSGCTLSSLPPPTIGGGTSPALMSHSKGAPGLHPEPPQKHPSQECFDLRT